MTGGITFCINKSQCSDVSVLSKYRLLLWVKMLLMILALPSNMTVNRLSVILDVTSLIIKGF
jgi:hypothetical protein